MVLADGAFVTASETEHPDLFWALRGGGGNFGVVTSFLFRLHPISTLYAGPMLWPLERAAEVLRWYREFIAQAPETLNGFFAFLTVPPAAPFPGGPLEPEDVRRRLVPTRGHGAGGGDVCPDPRPVRSAGARLGRADAHPALQSMFERSIRRASSGIGRPTSSTRSPTRRSISTSNMRAAAADLAIDHAPLSDQRRGGPGAARTPRPGTIGTPTGAWSSSGSAPIRPTTSA